MSIVIECGIVPKPKPRVTRREVLIALSRATGLPEKWLTGRIKRQELIVPRHIGYYLCQKLTGSSYFQIGQTFNRDHSTIISGIRNVNANSGGLFAGPLAEIEPKVLSLLGLDDHD